jgi:hypothetical protein
LPLNVTCKVAPLMTALVNVPLRKSIVSPICHPEIVPTRDPGCWSCSTPAGPPKITPFAVPPP